MKGGDGTDLSVRREWSDKLVGEHDLIKEDLKKG